ncbi:Pyridoxal phosphate-dependent transferase, major domain, partial [Sesbania bispinosa]
MIAIPYLTALTTYFSYGLLFAFGQFRDFFRKIIDWFKSNNLQGYAPICLGLEDFYIRRLYLRIQDCFGRPIASAPDAWFDVVERFSNDMPSHLEEVLREQIADGQPRTHRPWKKIMVIVEGIYSMEGELCKLPEIIAICKKYKAYTYLDEAHSIGAVGKTGRGVCELLGVDTADVDIMMGTFTKSFGSCGGYIAGSKGSILVVATLGFSTKFSYDSRVTRPLAGRFAVHASSSCSVPGQLQKQSTLLTGLATRLDLIQYLKYTCPAHLYATSISPPAAQQIISSIKVILGEDGSNRGAQKLAQIRENSNFFRSELQKMGFEVLGDNDSPVMPIMLYNPAKIPAFSRECLKQNVAVVTVAFPATPLLLARARICISASHSKEDLIKALQVISRVGDLVGIKYFPAESMKQQQE